MPRLNGSAIGRPRHSSTQRTHNRFHRSAVPIYSGGRLALGYRRAVASTERKPCPAPPRRCNRFEQQVRQSRMVRIGKSSRARIEARRPANPAPPPSDFRYVREGSQRLAASAPRWTLLDAEQRPARGCPHAACQCRGRRRSVPSIRCYRRCLLTVDHPWPWHPRTYDPAAY